MRRHPAGIAVLAFLLTWTVLVGPGEPFVPALHAQSPPLGFADVTAQVGVNAASALDPTLGRATGDWNAIAVGDYDGDGRDDLLLNTHPGFKLYRNQGNGTFVQAPFSLPAVVQNYNDHRHLLLWCDIDTDGDDDLIIGTGFDSATRVNLWMRNNGDGTFSNVASALRVEDPGSNDWAATCADLDRNGWPDVLFLRQGQDMTSAVQRLWMNYAMTFREEAQSRGFTERGSGRPYAAAFADISGDGYPEGALVGNNENFWALNRGDATFLLTTGVYEPIGSLSPYLHDAEAADFNGDGLLDWVILDTFGAQGNPIVSMYCGNGRFDTRPIYANGWDFCWRSAQTAGGALEPRSIAAGDFDNDGDVDFFATRAGGLKIDARTAKGQDYLYVNDGTGKFTESIASVPILRQFERTRVGAGGAAVIDYDLDGRLDLVVGYNMLYAPGPFRVYRNVSPQRNWVGFILRAPLILGANVELNACGRRQIRQVTAATGWLAQDSRNVHFGLGTCQVPARVVVRWPNGAVTDRTVTAGEYYVLSAPGGGTPSPATPPPPPPPPPTHHP